MAWRNNKYGNHTAKYNGKSYHSKFEAEIAQELDIRLQAGELKEVSSQCRQKLVVNGMQITTYIPDFRVVTSDGVVQYIEAKGMLTQLGAIKMKLFSALLPEIEPDAEYWVYWYNGKREKKV